MCRRFWILLVFLQINCIGISQFVSAQFHLSWSTAQMSWAAQFVSSPSKKNLLSKVLLNLLYVFLISWNTYRSIQMFSFFKSIALMLSEVWVNASGNLSFCTTQGLNLFWQIPLPMFVLVKHLWKLCGCVLGNWCRTLAGAHSFIWDWVTWSLPLLWFPCETVCIGVSSKLALNRKIPSHWPSNQQGKIGLGLFSGMQIARLCCCWWT